MEIESLLFQSVLGASMDAIYSILSSETLSESLIPSLKLSKKSPVSKKYKRILSKVMTEILFTQDVKFDPLHVSYIPIQLCLLINFNTDNSYVIFSLF